MRRRSTEDFNRARVRRLYRRTREILGKRRDPWSMRRVREALVHAEQHDRK